MNEIASSALYTNSSLRSGVHSLLAQFEDVRTVLATSECGRGNPLSSGCLSSLLNSENSPYGCDETVTSLGTKLWGYQLGTEPTLEDMIVSHLPLPLRHSASQLLPWDEPQALLDQLADKGLISYELLAVFRALGIESVNLTISLSPDAANISQVNPRQTLRAFQLPNAFRDLSILTLRFVPLKDDDLTCLGLLRLSFLDISSTGISSEATAHLVILKSKLESLAIANNPNVKHCASYNVSNLISIFDTIICKVTHYGISQLACLTNLRVLDIYGTGLKMLSLRYIIERFTRYNTPLARLDMQVPCTSS